MSGGDMSGGAFVGLLFGSLFGVWAVGAAVVYVILETRRIRNGEPKNRIEGNGTPAAIWPLLLVMMAVAYPFVFAKEALDRLALRLATPRRETAERPLPSNTGYREPAVKCPTCGRCA